VLHLQAAGDPAVPSGLGDWFTERAFHFYLARLALGGRGAGRPLRSALADLDAACGQLRDADGIGHMIVSARGRAALAVALWADVRGVSLAGGGADALILSEPALPARPVMNLDIACPVLVLTSAVSSGPARTGPVLSRLPRMRLPHTGAVRAALRPRRPAAAMARLGSHVTWIQLPEAGGQAVFDELGRWLGAYMYGSGRDQLL
jgi:hypothetical protein